jgi:ABC-2 type transport system ATP-binding protein
MIEIKHLSKKLGNQMVLSDVSFDVPDGDKLIILGQNGAGKTTLIRCILGEYKPTSGVVKVNGVSPVSNRAVALGATVFVPQLPPPLRYTVAELLKYAEDVAQCDSKKMKDCCAFFDFDFASNAMKPFYKLSGGMKQKVLISIAFARPCSIMIFDEPTANLDIKGRESFQTLLSDASRRDKTFIFISHRVEDVSAAIKRSIELDLGKVVKDAVL